MKYIFGPETIWVLIYLIALLVTKNDILPPKTLDEIIINSWYWLPLVTILSFGLYWLPLASNHWLMPRIWIVSLIFGHLTLEHLTSAYTQQGPGIGTTYIAGMLFLFAGLIAGSIVITVLKMSQKI